MKVGKQSFTRHFLQVTDQTRTMHYLNLFKSWTKVWRVNVPAENLGEVKARRGNEKAILTNKNKILFFTWDLATYLEVTLILWLIFSWRKLIFHFLKGLWLFHNKNKKFLIESFVINGWCLMYFSFRFFLYV